MAGESVKHKKVVIAFILGWLVSIVFSPAHLTAMFGRGKTG